MDARDGLARAQEPVGNANGTTDAATASAQPDARMALAWGAGLLGSALAFWRAHALFARRLQGFTGDCLGTTQQVCELAFYLGLALGLGAAAHA
jgi:cobalamin synthase